jgi:hypothetical protein
VNYRALFFICCALLLGSLLLNLPGHMQAQEAEPPKPVAGRYMVTSTQVAAGNVQVTVCDTFTGQCWVRAPGKWLDIGAPVEK